MRFYKSAKQVKAEEERKEQNALEDLSAKIMQEIVSVKARPGYNGWVCVTPVQRTYSDWEVTVKTFQEALDKVAERRGFWAEWETRGVEIYNRETEPNRNDPTDHIQIYPSPTRASVVGVKVWTKNYWVRFREQPDGSWVEIDTVTNM